MAMETSISVVCLSSRDVVVAASCSCCAYASACDEQTPTTGSSGHQETVAILEIQRARNRWNYVVDDAENICKRSPLTRHGLGWVVAASGWWMKRQQMSMFISMVDLYVALGGHTVTRAVRYFYVRHTGEGKTKSTRVYVSCQAINIKIHPRMNPAVGEPSFRIIVDDELSQSSSSPSAFAGRERLHPLVHGALVSLAKDTSAVRRH